MRDLPGYASLRSARRKSPGKPPGKGTELSLEPPCSNTPGKIHGWMCVAPPLSLARSDEHLPMTTRLRPPIEGTLTNEGRKS